MEEGAATMILRRRTTGGPSLRNHDHRHQHTHEHPGQRGSRKGGGRAFGLARWVERRQAIWRATGAASLDSRTGVGVTARTMVKAAQVGAAIGMVEARVGVQGRTQATDLLDTRAQGLEAPADDSKDPKVMLE